MTRHDDSTVCNFRRAEIANNLNADMFISIHLNAFYSSHIHGIETWYADAMGRPLAAIMQREKIRATGAHDRGLMNQPNFVVLRETNMPAALLEVGYITNPEEALRIIRTDYQWLLANAIYRGIVEAFAALPFR
jgi:N-acetylmuramoyl-L-alanine amidase